MTLSGDLRAALPDGTVRDSTELRESARWEGTEPELIASPASADEVSRLLLWAGQEGVGVLPMASGARVEPAGEGRFIALDTARLSGIAEYESADLTITAGAGTSFGTVDDALREHRQWAPFDPPAIRSRSMGGLVSDAAHGPLWAGYGALKNHVLGATVVTGDGRVLRLGGKVVKNVAGYDLLRPVVGGRGRLGVITSVCVRAFPLPTHERVLMVTASSVTELVSAALAVGTAPILPVSIVVAGPLETLDGRSALVVRLHGAEATVDADQRKLESHLGTAFQSPEASDGADAALLSELRDRGGIEARAVEISVLPSRLHDVVSAAIENGADPLVIDSYAGRIRIGSDELDAARVDTLRTVCESVGGALRVVRWNGPGRPMGTPLREAEVRLGTRLESIFDPGGVLWPTRS